MVTILVTIAITLVVWEIFKFGGRFMASVQELSDKLAAAAVSVQALADAYKAKQAGIDPAALDAVGAAADNLKAVADGALNPGA